MALDALSPLDGRYQDAIAPLREHFSEYAFLRSRLEIEVRHLAALGYEGLIRPLEETEQAHLMSFTRRDAARVKELEIGIRHDMKAVEYFLRERMSAASSGALNELIPFLHFGLTSEDVNNLAQALALRDSRDKILLPALDGLLDSLRAFAISYRAAPMLGRTHGQPAVPTTLGKEFALFYARLRVCRQHLASHRFQGKLTGAVGNFNALQAAFPDMDWLSFSRNFVESLGLQASLATTQILPADNWVQYFQQLQLTNTTIISLAQDIWRYISDGYLTQAVIEGEVGSSTMPQKVNPIDLENAEGNAGIANAHLDYYAQKLPISRLQRDLSDSTVRRTFGAALGHTLLAWQSASRGLSRLAADEARLLADLDSHWEVITEGAQTILRAAGHMDAYESLLAFTRGRALTRSAYQIWVDGLDVDSETRARLAALSPTTYIGLAARLVDELTVEPPAIDTEQP